MVNSLRKRILFGLFLSLIGATVSAQNDAPAETETTDNGGFLQAPTLEPSAVTGDAVEPDITITKTGSDVVYEYRVRGALYMVRVQPQIGPAYYFYDLNGDGMIDAQERSTHNTAVPQWELFHWN
ncbi:hypothetical protein CKO09_10075 [Chromatium weissei]|nr:hypothetical protein [Chromatium weissei]